MSKYRRWLAVPESICPPSGRTCIADAYEIGPNSMQEDDKLAAFACAQALDGNF